MIMLPAGIDVTTRWAECHAAHSVMAWRAISMLLLAYSRLEMKCDRAAIANDLLTLSELAQQHACILAPFEDMEAA